VPHGPHQGMLLACTSGSNWLGVVHQCFTDSIPVRVVAANDADNDGMLDTWELAHGLNTNSAADAADDPDGDGVSNLHEFRNGTDPGVWQEVFAFPPLHRYPYSNGCYCAPDVNLEWFASTTLGRYEVEAAVWPGCEALVYRGTVWNTNAIGDAIVHTADLSAGMGTQVAFRVRAAFTNEVGWTAWSGWRPFTVLEPLEDHTLRLANGEPLRAAYFFFWDYTTNSLLNCWIGQNYSHSAITNALAALSHRTTSLQWRTDDHVCTTELAFLKEALTVNTVLLDQWASACFRGGISCYEDVHTNFWLYDLEYWSSHFNRDNRLCKSQGMHHLPWLSFNGHRGIAQTHVTDSDLTNQEVYAYLQARYNRGPLERTTGRRHGELYQDSIMGDITGTNYQAVWCAFINEYIERYAENTNTAANSLVRVRWRGKNVPVVAPIVELSMEYVRDFGDGAIAEFRQWLAQRYGCVVCLNHAWTGAYASFEDITPFAFGSAGRQDHPLFDWDVRRNQLVRACDDYDEFIIERFVAGWRRVCDEVRSRRDVCMASEYSGPLYTAIGNTPPIITGVPCHRLSDFADVIVQRHGFDVDSARTAAMYADWLKAGKHVVFAARPVQNFEDHATIQRHYTRSAFAAGANAGFYSWNELWDLSALIVRLNATNGTKRFFTSMDAREASLVVNGSFEVGRGRYMPHWKVMPPSQVGVSEACSISGVRSVKVAGAAHAMISAEPIECHQEAAHILLMYVMTSGNLPGEATTVEVRIGSSDPRRMTLTRDAYLTEEQAQDAELLWQAACEDTQATMPPAMPRNDGAGRWIGFCGYFAPGELSGSEVLQIEIDAPEAVDVYVDRVSLIAID